MLLEIWPTKTVGTTAKLRVGKMFILSIVQHTGNCRFYSHNPFLLGGEIAHVLLIVVDGKLELVGRISVKYYSFFLHSHSLSLSLCEYAVNIIYIYIYTYVYTCSDSRYNSSVCVCMCACIQFTCILWIIRIYIYIYINYIALDMSIGIDKEPVLTNHSRRLDPPGLAPPVAHRPRRHLGDISLNRTDSVIQCWIIIVKQENKSDSHRLSDYPT